MHRLFVHWVDVLNATDTTFIYKWLLMRAASHSWVPIELSSPRMESFTQLSQQTRHCLLSFTLPTWIFEATNTSLEQLMFCARFPWRVHRAIRHPSGRHPVFTGKPLKPGLMHSKHTSLCKCGWWLSGPFFILFSAFARHQWPFKRGQAAEMSCFIRLGSPEPGAKMRALDIYSSTAVMLLRPARLCHFLLRWGPDGLSADILRWGRHPLFSCIVSIWGSHCAPRFGNCRGWNRFQGQNHRSGLF